MLRFGFHKLCMQLYCNQLVEKAESAQLKLNSIEKDQQKLSLELAQKDLIDNECSSSLQLLGLQQMRLDIRRIFNADEDSQRALYGRQKPQTKWPDDLRFATAAAKLEA